MQNTLGFFRNEQHSLYRFLFVIPKTLPQGNFTLHCNSGIPAYHS